MDKFRNRMDPLMTRTGIRRIYQEISFCFLFISLVAFEDSYSGVIRMVDTAREEGDPLCALSWGYTGSMWGILMSPIPFSSEEIGSRLSLELQSDVSSYQRGTPIASFKVLLRIGIKPPLINLREIFLWPHEEELNTQVFTSEEEQARLLNLISSYYSRGDSRTENFWNKLERTQMPMPACNYEGIVHHMFPCLEGVFKCYPYWAFNYMCMDSGKAFLSDATNITKEMMRSEIRWNECIVDKLFHRLCSIFPGDVHPGHISDYGAHNPNHLRGICKQERQCLHCSGLILPGSHMATVSDISERRKRTPSMLGILARGIVGLIGNPSGIPEVISRMLADYSGI